MTFNKVMLKLHLWIGLAAAIFLLIVGGTGTILEFMPLTGNHVAAAAQSSGPKVTPAEMLTAVQAAYPDGKIKTVFMPVEEAGRPMSAMVFPAGNGAKARPVNVCVDAAGTVSSCPNRGVQVTKGQRFMGTVEQLHKNLLQGRTGGQVVGWVTVISIFMAISGIILWWPRKILWFKKGASWRRINFDLHSVAGLYSAIFFFAIAMTGLMMYFGQVNRALETLTGQKRPVPVQAHHSTPPSPGAVALPQEQMLAMAESKVPGTHTLLIDFGIRPTDPVTITRSNGMGANGKATNVTGALDRYTGEVLAMDDSSKSPWLISIERNELRIHEGSYWGTTGRVIFGLASTSLPATSITGFIIWFKRKQTEWQRAKRKAKAQQPTPKELEELAEDQREDLDRVPSPVSAASMVDSPPA